MLTRWKLRNFKSVYGEADLELAPLTIFSGANSSGKSSFIQSILMVAQTLASRDGGHPVVLNGAHADLGQFGDVRSAGSGVDPIAVGFEYRSPVVYHRYSSTIHGRRLLGRRYSFEKLACDFSFDADLHGAASRILSSDFRCLMGGGERERKEVFASVRRRCVDSDGESGGVEEILTESDVLRRGLSYEVELDENSLRKMESQYMSAVPVGCYFERFLPNRFICKVDELQERAGAIADVMLARGSRRLSSVDKNEVLVPDGVIALLREMVGDAIPFDEMEKVSTASGECVSLSELEVRVGEIPRSEQIKMRELLGDKSDLCRRICDVMKAEVDSPGEEEYMVTDEESHVFESGVGAIRSFFSLGFKYLGPLREQPQSHYDRPRGVTGDYIGVSGEHTAAVLEQNKRRKVRCITPSRHGDSFLEGEPIATVFELHVAVVDWLRYLGVAESVAVDDLGKMGYQLNVGVSGSPGSRDLTQVGVGVSQVLPILVVCLLAGTGSTVVIEQPELHLHPRVQALLGDFFLAMALCGRQCIVETHSEHLVNRLRMRLAQAREGDKINKLSRIYFAEKEGRESTFRRIEVNEYGAVVDWPAGFFDQGGVTAEKILRAALEKRKTVRASHGR